MSESTSSPSVNVHPVSPSSSLSSTDSAPRSEPTSDEQPDLGFNELLREYSHLQPFPRIPIQIRSATSSTTPTYHAESVTGSDFRARGTVTRSTLSSVSTFTRPPTSSIQPDESTVWANPLITQYLPRSTPSNQSFLDGEEEDDGLDYSPSGSASQVSTPQTVEIRDVRSFNSHSLDPNDSSPEPISAIPAQVEIDNQQQFDSLETQQTEDDIDSLSSHNQRGSPLYRNSIHRSLTSSSQELSENSITSMQLQSQVIPDTITPTSISSLSLNPSDDMPISIAGPSAPSSINSRIDDIVISSDSTLMNAFLNDTVPPRAVPISSYPATRTISSSFSLISYQIPETSSSADVHREDSDLDVFSDNDSLDINGVRTTSSGPSISTAMLTPPSLNSSNTALPHRSFNSLSNSTVPITDSYLPNPHSVLAVSPLTNPHSFTVASTLINPHSLPPTSPLINPYSVAATPETDSRLLMRDVQYVSATLEPNHIVNDLDTPGQPPSEALLFEPPGRLFEPIHDEDEPDKRTSNKRTEPFLRMQPEAQNDYQSMTEYQPEGGTPRFFPIPIPKGVGTPLTRPHAGGSSEQIPSLSGSADTLPERDSTQRIVSERPVLNGSTTPSFTSSTQPHSEQRSSGKFPIGPTGKHFSYPTSPLISHLRRKQVHSSYLGLHLLPFKPSHAIILSPSENESLQKQDHSSNLGTDSEAEQLVEATTSQNRLLPSLGYLDEALSFIASERLIASKKARLTAVRVGTAAGDTESDGKGESKGLQNQEAEDLDKSDEPKRKRHRKKPAKEPESPAREIPNGPDPNTNFPLKKRRSRSAARPLSHSASIPSLLSSKSGTTTPRRRKEKLKGKEFLIRPPPPSSNDPRSIVTDSDLEEGGRTPTINNTSVPGVIRVSSLIGFNSSGVKGKRVGKKDRERLKFDKSKAKSTQNDIVDPDSFDDAIDIGVEYDTITDKNDDEVIEEGQAEDDSISNMSLLKPPRRLRPPQNQGVMNNQHTKDDSTEIMGHIPIYHHLRADEIKDIEPIESRRDVKRNDAISERRKESRRTRPTGVGQSLNVDPEPRYGTLLESEQTATAYESRGVLGLQNQSSSDTKQSRLVSLAKYLQQQFPEQHGQLARVLTRIENPNLIPKATMSPSGTSSSDRSRGKTMPIPVPSKGKRAGKGHGRTVSEGVISTGSESFEVLRPARPVTDAQEEEQKDDIDPRGPSPAKQDPLIHVFIDHSNILIGLLSHLRRAKPDRKGLYIARRKPLPAVLTTVSAQAEGSLVAAPVAASSSNNTSRPLAIQPDHNFSSVIPLPSFATLPRSIPSAFILSSIRKMDGADSSEELERKQAVNSDGSGIENGQGSGGNDGSTLSSQKERKPSKHLWHAALILVLERGRPVTRRVAVASSPLYQPMESMERFGYDLRVFMRVPDMGEGLDREHHSEKTDIRKTGQAKRISGSESGSGGNASGGPPGGSHGQHLYYAKSKVGTSPGKVKYREQGVDELLQLKLHQAIAASDDVPDGSTIILATGDGNMGQFNEEGFLGPIRTALRRGWKVELYAWEGGLSRAWKREFGESTEWGKRGRFRIIGMEQFGGWLVEAAEWT